MKNELLTKGIILPSGEIGKNKINLVAGAITQPFAEMVWVTTGGDMETINRLTNVLVTMNNPTDRGKLFKIIKLLYGLMGLPFSEEAEPMDADPDVLEYFIFSFMADFGEVMYCRMLDAMLSKGQEDENGILFVCFPVTAIAAVLSRSSMTVKRSLNELETAGLMDSGELEYIQNGNRRLIADAAIWDWYHRAKKTAKPPARQGG